jgi:hypothetical protein
MSNGRRTKEKGDQKGQTIGMWWFSAVLPVEAHTCAALSPMMISEAP